MAIVTQLPRVRLTGRAARLQIDAVRSSHSPCTTTANRNRQPPTVNRSPSTAHREPTTATGNWLPATASPPREQRLEILPILQRREGRICCTEDGRNCGGMVRSQATAAW